jgi:hypothetical protein
MGDPGLYEVLIPEVYIGGCFETRFSGILSECLSAEMHLSGYADPLVDILCYYYQRSNYFWRMPVRHPACFSIRFI